MNEESRKDEPQSPKEKTEKLTSAPKEVFTVEMGLGDKTCHFDAKFDQPSSAIAAITALCAAYSPEVSYFRITRPATGDVLCDVPFERLQAQIGPSLNEIAGKVVTPVFKVIGDDKIDRLKESGRALRNAAETKDEK